MAERKSRERNLSKSEKVLLLLQDYEKSFRAGYSAEQKKILCGWFRAHVEHPYPTKEQQIELGYECDVRSVKVKEWFERRRCHIWKPIMVCNF